MIHYAWLIWSLMFLLLWGLIFLCKKNLRREMIVISIFTLPLGLTEPLFVPGYWYPQSLFNLAQRTGFDIESFIFAFAIGGVIAVLYNIIFNVRIKRLPENEMQQSRHQWHSLILISPFLTFLILAFFTNLNHIYCGIIACLVGSLAAIYCRPDLIKKIFVAGILFLVLYFIFFLSLLIIFPDFVQETWNLKAISGILILGIPLEELLFAFSFGMLWSSLYEHYYWFKDE